MTDGGLLASLTLARGELDRAAERRDDSAWFESVCSDPATRTVIVHGGRALVRGEGAEPGDIALETLAPGTGTPVPLEAIGAATTVRVLLGVEDASVYVAALVDEAVEPWEAPTGARWAGLREVGAALGDRDAALLVPAVALANWHAGHPRCPRCGAPTAAAQAGWSRRCEVDESQQFPRSDPAVIVLIRDDEGRALLGRRAEWPEGFYSTLAGFVEAGESAEMTVRREMAEEAGVLVDRLEYLGSQPWPFPASLMLGYHARLEAGSPPPRPDGVEIVEVRWFTREEMRAGCEAGSVLIPPRVSIARRLVEHWYGAELPGAWARP